MIVYASAYTNVHTYTLASLCLHIIPSRVRRQILKGGCKRYVCRYCVRLCVRASALPLSFTASEEADRAIYTQRSLARSLARTHKHKHKHKHKHRYVHSSSTRNTTPWKHGPVATVGDCWQWMMFGPTPASAHPASVLPVLPPFRPRCQIRRCWPWTLAWRPALKSCLLHSSLLPCWHHVPLSVPPAHMSAR